MATFTKVTYGNASPKGGGDNRLNSIPAKAKHLSDLIDVINRGHYLATEAITGAGACSTEIPVTFVDTTGGAAAITLAAGTVAGAIKHIIMVKDGGDATLTITGGATVNTVTFAAIGDAITLINAADEDGTIVGWTYMSRESGLANAASAFDGPALSAV